MNYEEAYNFSKIWIKQNNPRDEDYEQECALYFFSHLVKKGSPEEILPLCKKAYHWIYLKQLREQARAGYILDDEELFNQINSNYDDDNDVNWWDDEETLPLVNLIIEGWRPNEIISKLNLTPSRYKSLLSKIRSHYPTTGKGKGTFRNNWNDEHKQKLRDKSYNKRRVRQINPATGEIVRIWDSIREASLAVGGDVSVALVRGYKCKGWKWEYDR